jgi:hypothetical protein
VVLALLPTRVLTVAATAIDRHGDRFGVEEELPCPDCRPAPEPPADGPWMAEDGRSRPPA